MYATQVRRRATNWVVDHLETEGYLVTEHNRNNDPASVLSGIDVVVIASQAANQNGDIDAYVSVYRTFTGGLFTVDPGA